MRRVGPTRVDMEAALRPAKSTPSVMDRILDAAAKLDAANAPRDGRRLVVSPAMRDRIFHETGAYQPMLSSDACVGIDLVVMGMPMRVAVNSAPNTLVMLSKPSRPSYFS